MRLTDYKVPESVFNAEGVSALPDRPSANGYSAAQLKAAFDNLVRNYVGENLNAVLDELASGNGADLIGASVPGSDGNTIKEVLQEIMMGGIGTATDHFIVLNQAEYDALEEKENKLYFILG